MTRQLHAAVPTSETPGCRLQRQHIQMRDLCHPLNSCGAQAAWLNGNRLTERRKRECALTSTGLLKELPYSFEAANLAVRFGSTWVTDAVKHKSHPARAPKTKLKPNVSQK